MEARGLDLLRLRVVFIGADDFLDLRRGDVELSRGGPHGSAFRVEDGSFIDVTSADEARWAGG